MKKIYLFISIILIISVGILIFFKFFANQPQGSSNSKKLTKKLIKFNATYIANDMISVPILVAVNNKIFEKYGIEVLLMPMSNGSLSTSTLLSGRADIAVGPPSPLMLASLSGGGVKFLGVLCKSAPFVFVTSKKTEEIKTVGVSSKTGEIYLRSLEFLKALNIDTNKINFVNVGGSDLLVKSMMAGSVDAGSFSELIWYTLKDKNNIPDKFQILSVPPTDKYLVKPIGIYATENTLKTKKGEIESFNKAMLEAEFWIKSNSDKKVAEVIGKSNTISKKMIPLFITTFKNSLKGTKFTPDLTRTEAIRKELETVWPEIKNYDVNKFVSFEISDSLRRQGILKKYDF